MSFVPVTGPARLLVGEPPREGSIEFTDDRRTIVMPIRGALPVLGKVRDQDDLHPSVALLAGAALLGLQLVAVGPLRTRPRGPALAGGRPRPGRRAPDRRPGALARLRRASTRPPPRAWSAALLDAVVDTMPRTTPGRSRHGVAGCPAGRPAPRPSSPDDFSDQLQQRIARIRSRGRDDRPHLVSISFRIEADEEELVAGAVRLVLQVHAVDNAAHMADASELWAEAGPDAAHGFGERARTHAAIALRSAADAWPVLDRLLDLRVPDEIILDSDEILSPARHRRGRADRGGAPGACGRSTSTARSPSASSSAGSARRSASARSRCRTGSSGRRRSSASSGSSRCTARS